jgi:hypothetical protein
MLEKSSSSSHEPREEEVLTVPEPQLNPKQTNLPDVQPSRITVHHPTAPTPEIMPTLSTKPSLPDGSAEEHSYSQDKVMLEIHVHFRDSVIYV